MNDILEKTLKNTNLINFPNFLTSSRVLFNRGTAKFAIYREISRNMHFPTKNREICPFPRKIAILTSYRDFSFLPFNNNGILY